MTLPDREHHLAKTVRIQSVAVSLTVLASDSDTGQYVTDVVDLGQLRTTIAIADIGDLSGPLEMLGAAFATAMNIGMDSVRLFDQRSVRFASELNALTERMAADRAARDAAPPVAEPKKRRKSSGA